MSDAIMKTFYCVTTTVNDKGSMTAHITSTVHAEEIPENTFISTSRRDIYNDWFDNLEDARQFVEDAKCA